MSSCPEVESLENLEASRPHSWSFDLMVPCGSLAQIISAVILALEISRTSKMARKGKLKNIYSAFVICQTVFWGWKDSSEPGGKEIGKNYCLHEEYFQMGRAAQQVLNK